MSNVKKTKCTGCQQSYRIPESKEGKTATCKKCGQKFKIKFEPSSESPPKTKKTTTSEKKKPTSAKTAPSKSPKTETKTKESPKPDPQESSEPDSQETTKQEPEEVKAQEKPETETQEKPETEAQEKPETEEKANESSKPEDDDQSFDSITDASTTDIEGAANEETESEDAKTPEEEPKKEEPPPPPKEKKKMLEYDRSYRPLDPDTLMESLDIVVSENDALEAHLVVKKPLERDTTYKDIHFFLAEKKVVFGVMDEDKIKNFLKKKLLHNRPWLVAEGKAPVPPKDGEVNYMFDVNPLKQIPAAEENDSKERIDFKDRGEMPYVKKGDLIAERTPGIPGVQGMDVYGKPIKTKKAKQATLRCGEGVELSYDKRLGNAKIDGLPMLLVERNQEKVIVLPEYFIKGDLNLKTGHAKFKGPVVVEGTVENGFKVISAQLSAKEIMKAEIDVEGDVLVGGGVIGATIQSKGKVEAKFIKGATIDCLGNVTAPGGIIDSKINTSGECIVEKGKILNSEICAYQGISTRDIGSHTSPESTITIGVDPALLKQVKQFEAEIAEKNKELEKVKEESKISEETTQKLEEIVSKIGPLQESVEKTEALRPALAQKLEAVKKKGKKKELKQTIKMIQEIETKFQAAKKNLAQLKEERETIEKEMGALVEIEKAINELQSKLDEVNELILDDRQNAPVKVTGNAYRGTIIKGVHSELEMKDDENKVVIQEVYKVDEEDKVESVIVSEPFTEEKKDKKGKK